MVKTRYFLLVSLLTFSFSIGLRADMQSRNINMTSATMHLDGNFIAAESCNFSCRELLTGNGLIKAQTIHITAKKFAFTGTIECSEACYIICQEPFDQKMFKRKGNGKFYISIDPILTFEKINSPFDISPIMPLPIPQPSVVAHPPFPPIPLLPKPEIARPAQSNEPEPTKEITIEGSVFTLKGTWHISIAEAITSGNLERTKELLEKIPEIKNDRKQLSNFMIMAGLSGHCEIAQEFILLGADVNGTDTGNYFGQKHLLTAVITKKAEFVSLLIKAGADPNIKNKEWIPAITIAILQNDSETVKALMQSPKIDLNARDTHHYTPLMHTAYKGQDEIVKILLQAGADVQANAGVHTALDFAEANNHYSTQRLLKNKLWETSPKASPAELMLIAGVTAFLLARPFYIYVARPMFSFLKNKIA